MKKLKTYWVTFDWGDYICDHACVTCYRKTQIKKILENQYGVIHKIRWIEEIDW